jgi:type I restriction enzyme, S subunit
MIPDGWRLAQLGELCSPKQWPTIGAKDMTPTGVPVFGANGFIGRYPTANHTGDTLVITCRGATCGEVSIVPGPSYITGNAMCLDDIEASKADQAFLAEAIRFAGTKPLISGSAQPQIVRADVLRFTVKIPPLPEQQRIAEILCTWDRAIERIEALMANARAQNKALMQALLTGKKRLPGFSGAWKHQQISEISTRINRRNDGTRLPVLTISSTSGFVRQDQKYSRFMAGKSVESYIMLRKGEFAYNKGNSKTYEFGCVFDLDEFECGLVPHVYVCFKLKAGYSHRFYKALFEADYLAPQLCRLVNTGIRNNGLLNITPAQFLSTSVPVPPLDEQDAIAAVMETASAKVRTLQVQLAGLREEKAALMQQLLTGKRRVKVDQREAA